jgi:hypothetical protein
MSQVPRQVLPYATPKSLRRVRKPLRTKIVREEGRGDAHFIEISAEEKDQVVWGMAFLGLTLLLIGWMGWREWERLIDYGMKRGRAGQAVFLTTFFLAQIGAILYVIDVVWTRTILAVRDGELSLEVEGPFRSSVRRWGADEVDGIEVWTTDEGDRVLEPVGEVHVRPRQGATVKLMRNYPRSELVPVVLELEAALRPPAGRADSAVK